MFSSSQFNLPHLYQYMIPLFCDTFTPEGIVEENILGRPGEAFL